jgi:hypothetical protein
VPLGITTARDDGRAPRVETSRIRSRRVAEVKVRPVPRVVLEVTGYR